VNAGARRWQLVSAIALLLSIGLAVPAWAARVIDVRVGRHAEFTRVVFELDEPAGYRIERHEPAPGIAELVISLDARAEARTLAASKKGLVHAVAIRPEGDRAVIHVRLARDGLRLKEMILSSPPRVVLDVLSPEPAAVAKPPPPPPPSPEPEIEPEIAVEEPPAIEEPPPAPAEPEVAELIPEEEAPSFEEPPSEAEASPLDELPADAGAPPESDLGLEAQAEEAEMAPPGPATSPPRTALPPKPTPPPSRAMPPRPEEPSGFGTGTILLAVGGLLLIVAGLIYLRRRGGSVDRELDLESLGSEGEENPFTGIASESEAPAAPDEGDTAGFVPDAGSSDEPSLFDAPTSSAEAQAEDSKGSDMDTTTTGFSPLPSPPTAATAGGADVMRLVQELERRVASLETRLDEAVDARERLERQVAAQTEELRVQRAAIARTQRAVRNMSRPEEDLATEPALRDPSQPSGPRDE
jgi:hypothetical protein